MNNYKLIETNTHHRCSICGTLTIFTIEYFDEIVRHKFSRSICMWCIKGIKKFPNKQKVKK